ncbi:MAG: sigma-54-dependent Fis family transcriptional regulator [Planctomycetes bacterium]|nr:sigma-54-dependent Fis family transcriptional regulator [Planctomycetota bacterium]
MADSAITGNILVVDDEKSVCDVIEVVLAKEGHTVTTVQNHTSALEAFEKNRFDVIIQDIKLPGYSGIDLLRHFKEVSPNVNVIMITAFDKWDTTVEAMRLGAFNYIKKPFDNNDIRNSVSRALLQNKLRNELLNKKSIGSFSLEMMVGNSKAIKEIHDLITRVAPSDTTVLICGESGSGKELVARALHYNSPRVYEPFITVNCAAFTETLLESELFGHVRGSFTGAIADKKGLVEVADKGTFFLDEISEISQEFQKKLLRLLEEKEFKSVGSVSTKKVDVRFIAATNRKLEEDVKTGRFRQDLFYRLNVIPISVPSLRARRDDIPYLAGYFLARYAKNMQKDITSFTNEAMNVLVNYDWPGNIRELENTIQRAITMCNEKTITTHNLVEKIQSATAQQPEQASAYAASEDMMGPGKYFDLEKEIAAIEKKYILEALNKTDFRLGDAADMLGITTRSLRYKIKKHNLHDLEKSE